MKIAFSYRVTTLKNAVKTRQGRTVYVLKL